MRVRTVTCRLGSAAVPHRVRQGGGSAREHTAGHTPGADPVPGASWAVRVADTCTVVVRDAVKAVRAQQDGAVPASPSWT